jgi:hypothetical protein
VSNPITTLVCALAIGIAQVPQDPTPAVQAGIDRFASAMQATTLVFEKSSSGKSYLVPFTHEDQRRTVYVALKPDQPTELSTHSIYTTVWTGKQPPDEATMRKAFSSTRKLGAYYLFADSAGTWAIRFGVAFDATDLAEKTSTDDPAAKRLREMIEFVNTVGRESQKELAK